MSYLHRRVMGPVLEKSERQGLFAGRCVGPEKCTEVRTDHDAAESNKFATRVVCRAAFVARLGAGAVLAEAGVLLLDPEGHLHCLMLPWRANEEADTRQGIAAAAARGWSGEATLRWLIERANGVTTEVCEAFQVGGDSVEEIGNALLHEVLLLSMEAPHRGRHEGLSGERSSARNVGAKARSKSGGHHG